MDNTFSNLFYTKLNLGKLELETQKRFLEAITKYLDHGRKEEINGRTINFVEKQLDSLIYFLECLDFSKEEMVRIITNLPTILNTVDDLYKKYLLLGVLEEDSRNSLRKDKLLNKTKDFMVGFNKIYARYKLVCEAGYDRLSWNVLVHASDREFCSIFVKSSYKKPYQLFNNPGQVMAWLRSVDASELNLEELKSLEVNKELVDKYEKRSKGIS